MMSFNALLPKYEASTPDINELLKPIATGYEQYQTKTNRAAIGSRMAAGDYTGAAAEAGRQGDLDTSLGIARFQTQQKQADTAQKTAELDHAAKAAHLYGGVAQLIGGEQDPAKASAMWNRVIGAHPEMGSKLTSWGIDPNDHKAGAAFLIAQARGYQDPTKEALGKTQLEEAQLNVQKTRRELEHPALDVKTVKEGETPYFVDRRTQKVQFLEVPGQGGPTKQNLDREAELRKEYAAIPTVKDFQTVRDAYVSVNQAAVKPSAAGDISMIFAYMKILDPGSVVREGEFATAQNAAGVPDRVRNTFNRMMNGERLNEAQRKDFIDQAHQLYEGRSRQYEAVRQQYGKLAEGAKVRPDQVMVNHGIVPDAATALSQARDAIQKGADPAAVAERLRKAGIDPSGLR